MGLKKVVLATKTQPTDPYGGRIVEFFMFITSTLATKKTVERKIAKYNFHGKNRISEVYRRNNVR